MVPTSVGLIKEARRRDVVVELNIDVAMGNDFQFPNLHSTAKVVPLQIERHGIFQISNL